ncbi:MAG: VWA domain-containing protein [Actinobacteria bacterium]|nr:VWA domain-containing protein [Actinomycetota bacterium]
MDVSFLSPWAFALAALALLAVAVLVFAERRSRRICGVLGLAPRRLRSAAIDAGALLALGGLLGLAAAQPVVSQVRSTEGRIDAETIVVFDISRSMLASAGPSAPTRLERARDIAKQLRAGLPDVPIGVSSLTDRLLPHLFPTMSTTAFTSTVDRAIEIERPPPERRALRATAFGALADLGRQNFFGRQARRRVAVVLTDGESVPFNLGELRGPLLSGRVTLHFVHLWDAEERVYDARKRAEGYRPSPISRTVLDRIVRDVGGGVHAETDFASALAVMERKLGTGPVAARGRELQAVPLAPYAAIAAVFPLGLVLLRRNF